MLRPVERETDAIYEIESFVIVWRRNRRDSGIQMIRKYDAIVFVLPAVRIEIQVAVLQSDVSVTRQLEQLILIDERYRQMNAAPAFNQ